MRSRLVVDNALFKEVCEQAHVGAQTRATSAKTSGETRKWHFAPSRRIAARVSDLKVSHIELHQLKESTGI